MATSPSGGAFTDFTQDVTGCLLSGPAGNDAERVFRVLDEY